MESLRTPSPEGPRFQIENIRQVSMTYNPDHDAVEFCVIEGPQGVVHWLTEAEHDTVKASLKARAKGPFTLRESEEAKALRAENAQLKALVKDAAKLMKA